MKRRLAAVLDRLRRYGLFATVVWLSGRSIPWLTGIPLHRSSRVTPSLFVGGQISRLGKRRLRRWGVTATVNMRIEFDDRARGLAFDDHCHLPTVDTTAPSLDHLLAGVAFIEKVLARGGKVYIHCESGVGRAPTMAAAYLIRQGHTPEAALAMIRRVRPFIDPTPAQLECLRLLWEQCGGLEPAGK